MTYYQSILADLFQVFPTEVRCPESFDMYTTHEEKFAAVTKALEHATRLGDRVLSLVYAFFLGKFLEKDLKLSPLRSYYKQQVSVHYKTVAIRVYYIFELPGVEQIMRTTNTSLTTVRKLSYKKYVDLVAKSFEIFNGVENLGGNDVTF